MDNAVIRAGSVKVSTICGSGALTTAPSAGTDCFRCTWATASDAIARQSTPSPVRMRFITLQLDLIQPEPAGSPRPAPALTLELDGRVVSLNQWRIERADVGHYRLQVSFRELSSSILLYSPGTEVVSIMIWELWQNGQYVELSALGVMLIILLFCLVMIAQLVGKRFGIAEH